MHKITAKTFQIMEENRVSRQLLMKEIGVSNTTINTWRANGINVKNLQKIKKYFATINVEYDLNYILGE